MNEIPGDDPLTISVQANTRLHAALLRQDMSWHAVAELADVDYSALKRAAYGPDSPHGGPTLRADAMARVSLVLQVPLTDLIDGFEIIRPGGWPTCSQCL